MKRFTATEKWADSWFRKLKPAHKLLWQYIVDSCDQSGVWKVDMELASFSIGAKVDATALEAFEGRVRDVGRGRWWMPGFIVFQFNGNLSEECPFHVKVIKLLEEHRLTALWEAYLNDLTVKDTTGDTTPHTSEVGIGEGIGRGEGKRECEGESKTGDLEIPEHLNTPAFLSEWDAWMLYRRGKKKGNQKESFKRHLKFLGTLSEPDARASIDKSIQCGWTGLFAVAQPTLSKPAPKWKQDQDAAAEIKRLEGEFMATQDEAKRSAIRARIAELRGQK